jgi:hypothetical protein
MLIGIGASIYSGNRYDAAISSANLAARFDAALGITASGGFASAWADQSGNGRSLLQATGANQPIHLPFSGTKYGWLPGVAGNYFSTPDSVANSITGDIDIRVQCAATDWTPAGYVRLVNAIQTAGQYKYSLLLSNASTGKLISQFSSDGTVVTEALSTVGVSFVDGSVGWVRVTRASATGTTKFYTSSDGTTWTQLGADVATTAGGLFDGTAALWLGSHAAGGQEFNGKIYQAQIYNGINGTLAVDFDASRYAGGTTLTGSTGETWTINSTGSKPAQIVDRSSLLFDGAAHYMKTAPFTLNQPETVYLVAKQVAWGNRYLHDGNAGDSMVLFQNTASPQLALYAGAFSGNNSGASIGSKVVITEVFNGATPVLRTNLGTEVTSGDVGAANAGGFTLGSNAGGASWANIQVYEVLIYNVAHDAATRANIARALMAKHGVA